MCGFHKLALCHFNSHLSHIIGVLTKVVEIKARSVSKALSERRYLLWHCDDGNGRIYQENPSPAPEEHLAAGETTDMFMVQCGLWPVATRSARSRWALWGIF